MRVPFIAALVIGLLSLASDAYILRAIVKRLNKPWIKWTHIVVALLCYAMMCVALLMPYRTGSDAVLQAVNYMLFTYCSVYFAKMIFIIFDLAGSLPCLAGKPRWKWLSWTGGGMAVLLFFMMWWGALSNRFNIQVKEVEVPVENLPEAFDGYRILQFSDFHVGSYYGDTTFVADVVEEINRLNPDAVFFTGDIVNRHTGELIPFVNILSRIDKPVYAILGNHDYGDYTAWPTPEDKQQNMQQLYDAFNRMGWRLLLNDTAMLKLGGDSIAIVGVENIGDPPFHIYGDLKKAYPALGDSVTKILLTHNPAHWVDEIAGNDTANVALTLSGHTHAMQMELLGYSPAVFRYSTWGGLYHDTGGKHPLYVNIGLGTVGIPARIGATPELTMITLKKQ